MGIGRKGTPWTKRGRQPSADKKVVFYLMLSVINLAESSCVDLPGDKNKELKQQVKWVNPKQMWSSCCSDQAAGRGVQNMLSREGQVYPEANKSFTLLWMYTVKDVRNETIMIQDKLLRRVVSFNRILLCL